MGSFEGMSDKFGKNKFDDNTPPHSISYFHWFIKLKSLYNQKINSEQRPDKANKANQNSSVENSESQAKQQNNFSFKKVDLHKERRNSKGRSAYIFK